jgi:hypothetical protein
MQKKAKFLAVLLVAALNITVADAQSFSSYVQQMVSNMTTLPFYRALTRPPLLTHAQQVMQDNEFERKTVGQDANFYANPLLVNGKPLDYDTFDMFTNGILTLVKGNPASKDAKAVPFYLSIRRKGKIITDKKMPFLNKALYRLNLSDFFPFVEFDDVLIINPVNAEDWKGKRILKLVGGC